MISTENIDQARKLIKNERRPIIIKAQNDEFNRRTLEHEKFDILLSPERGIRKDTIKQADSGLNEVLASIAARKKISIGIDIEEISTLTKKEKAERLSRIRQNISLCRKAKVSIKILFSKKVREAKSLLLTLGASTKQTKEAIDF